MRLIKTVAFGMAAGYWLGCFTAFLLDRFTPSRFDMGLLMLFAFVNFLLWTLEYGKGLKPNE